MLWRISVIGFLLILFLSASAQDLMFQGYPWKLYFNGGFDTFTPVRISYRDSTINQTVTLGEWSGYHYINGLTINGNDVYGTSDDSGLVFSSGNHTSIPYADTMHVKHAHRLSPYYYDPGLDPNPLPTNWSRNRGWYDSLGVDSVRFITHYHLSERVHFGQNGHTPPNLDDYISDTTYAALCGYMRHALLQERVWFGAVGAVTANTFRYGKYYWESPTDFTVFSDLIDASVGWSIDPWNLEYSRNEIDFEFNHFNTPDSGRMRLTIQPAFGPDVNPPGWGSIYRDRGRAFPEPNGGSSYAYRYTYKPDSVNFHISGGTYDERWDYPAPGTSSHYGYKFKDYRSGFPSGWPLCGQGNPTHDDSVLTKTCITPPCGPSNYALVSMLAWGPNISVSGQADPDTLEMIITKFKWEGIPDLSFTSDTVGAPWPWDQLNPCVPNVGWSAPVVITTSSTSHQQTTTGLPPFYVPVSMSHWSHSCVA